MWCMRCSETPEWIMEILTDADVEAYAVYLAHFKMPEADASTKGNKEEYWKYCEKYAEENDLF